MGKLKNQMIIDQELAIVAAESWEHSVMANLRDYLAVHGVQDFKDAEIRRTVTDLANKQLRAISDLLSANSSSFSTTYGSQPLVVRTALRHFRCVSRFFWSCGGLA